MSNTRTHGLYRGDKVVIGKGKAEWTVTFATEHHVIVTREHPHRNGWREMRRYFYGAQEISTLKLVSR